MDDNKEKRFNPVTNEIEYYNSATGEWVTKDEYYAWLQSQEDPTAAPDTWSEEHSDIEEL